MCGAVLLPAGTGTVVGGRKNNQICIINRVKKKSSGKCSSQYLVFEGRTFKILYDNAIYI
jgi:hypothetical protein